MRTSIAWGVALSLAAGGVQAQPASAPSMGTGSPPEDVDVGYCRFVRGVADAEAAVLMAPDVFLMAGAVNAGEASGSSAPLGSPKLRLTAGVGYDLVDFYRGLTLRRRAEADCRRHQVLSALQAAVQAGATGIGTEAALAARAAVLEAALPQGEQLLTGLREDVREGRATLAELNALQLRLDSLRALASDTARERALLASRAPLPNRPLSALLLELREADDAVEERSAGLRAAAAWEVRLRGGYDEVFDVRQDVPLFGTLTVSYNLGGLWQSGANTRAREGRRAAAEEEVEGIHRRVALLLQELRAAREAEQTRLRELTVLVTDLEGQLRGIDALETSRARRYRDYLLLELAKLRAEQAYLKAHVEGLDAFLGAEGP